MSQPQPFKLLTLEETDLAKQNEALIIENDVLKDQLQESYEDNQELANRIVVLTGLHSFGLQPNEDVGKLYAEVENAIEGFIDPMRKLINEGATHKANILDAMRSPGSAKVLRTAVACPNQDFQAAAMNPRTGAGDIWTAWIWRFLVRRVFSDAGALLFYTSRGENAAYYMRSINEIDYLMQNADAGEFGVYARRLWKRQALSALFRTAKHSWVESTRAAKIEQLSKDLIKVFQVFVNPMADGTALALARRIFTAAARLNEYTMTEANDIWTVDLQEISGTDQDFYNKLEDMDLKPLGTATALRDNLPLENIRSRLGPDVIKQRLTKLCVVSPGIRFHHIAPGGDEYQAPVNLVKPRVLVSLREADPPPHNIANVDDQASHGDMVFYTMAQSLGLC